MASLTQIAVTSRKAIRYGIYGVIIFFLARGLFFAARNLYRRAFPPPPPPPTVAFGTLPKLEFPQKTGLPELSYKIETPTGQLPEFPEQMKVYFMPQPSPQLLAFEEARDKVSQLGFSSNPEILSQTTYRFAHSSSPSQSLEINIISQAFSISFDLTKEPDLVNSTPPIPDVAISNVRSFLNNGDFLAEDLEESPTSHEFLRIEGQNLVTAPSLSEANLIKVNIFRTDIEETYPSLTHDPNEANTWFIVSGTSGRGARVIAGEYHYLPIDINQNATYPIKSAETAVQELSSGNAYIANLGLNEGGEITIRNIYLAYYDPDSPQEFYQPIVVFEGDGGFKAYVPAVTSELQEE